MIELHPELARAIVTSLPAAIAVLDTADRVVWGNAELGDLLRLDMEDIIGCGAASLQLPLPDPGAGVDSNARHGVVERGRLVGICQTVGDLTFKGRILVVIEKKFAIDWFMDVLSTGNFDPSITSRLLSRNALLNRLQLEVSRSRRYANPLSCLVIRIEFAAFEGQKPGREVHSLIASTLTELLRWVDVLGQWSERALVVVLPETTDKAAQQLAGKVADAINDNLKNSTADVRINVGASTWRKGDDAARLVRRAEIVARRQIGSTTRSMSY